LVTEEGQSVPCGSTIDPLKTYAHDFEPKEGMEHIVHAEGCVMEDDHPSAAGSIPEVTSCSPARFSSARNAKISCKFAGHVDVRAGWTSEDSSTAYVSKSCKYLVPPRRQSGELLPEIPNPPEFCDCPSCISAQPIA
jgi:hypothetical protein